jgi:hypothetical protein
MDMRMTLPRWIAPALVSALVTVAAHAAELPSQRGERDKSKKPEYVTPCTIAGSPGILAANGVCVRISGSISAQFSAGQLK